MAMLVEHMKGQVRAASAMLVRVRGHHVDREGQVMHAAYAARTPDMHAKPSA